MSSTEKPKKSRKRIIILIIAIILLLIPISCQIRNMVLDLGQETQLNVDVKAKFYYKDGSNGNYNWFDDSISSIPTDITLEISGESRKIMQEHMQNYQVMSLDVENGNTIPFAIEDCKEQIQVTICSLKTNSTYNMMHSFDENAQDMVDFAESAYLADSTNLKYWTRKQNDILSGTVNIYFSSLSLRNGSYDDITLVSFEDQTSGENTTPHLNFNISHTGLGVII